MSDFSQYPYQRLLTYIENECQQQGEERDFINYLLSMEHAESIEHLIKIYDNIYKLLAVLFFRTKKLPNEWYKPETWGYSNEYLIEELNYCLNDNILKWFNSQNSKTKELCFKCISNLRESKNTSAIEGILYKELTHYIDDVNKEILYFRSRHYTLRKELERYCPNKTVRMNDYIYCSSYLAGHGRIFDIAEIKFAKERNITYEGLAEQYWKKVDLENTRKKAELNEKRMKMALIVIFIVPLLILLIYVLNEIGFLGIIIIIGFIGLLPKILLTGKI